MKKNRVILAILMVFVMALSLAASGCSKKAEAPKETAKQTVESTMTLATTTSTQDSGLLDVLIPAFEQEVGTKVKVVAVGSGEAIAMGQRGDADVLLVHSRKAEDQFVASGFGVNRRDVMYNEFLIVGPESDPAKIKGGTDAVAAFKAIADTQSKFISRGDKSGTNTKELDIWSKAGIKPAAPWYVEAGKGMGETLTMANEMKAYTLTDEATYLTWKSKAGNATLPELVRGDKVLFNPYGVIAVNPEKFPNVKKNAANAFIEFITGEKGKKIISEYGKDKFGKALFTFSYKAQ